MKRVNFVSLDSLTLQWFCNTLQTQHPQTQAAKELYEALNTSRDEIVLDDRKGRAGPKFKDADLIGYPVRLGGVVCRKIRLSHAGVGRGNPRSGQHLFGLRKSSD